MALRLQFAFTEGTLLEAIVMDATLSESHSHTADVTDYPVERGANISDNVRAKPVTLTVDGYVSDFPLHTNVIQQFTAGAFTERPTEDLRRSQNVLDKLIKLKDKGTLIIVTTGARTYQNMVVTSVQVNRDKTVINGLRLNIAMRSIELVDTQTVQIKVEEKKAEPKRKDGPKTKKEASSQTTEKSKSALKRFLGG